MGTLALEGRDKLTLVTSPAIGSFGLWVEQLIAESTGKEGKGIVPIAGEPLATPDNYGNDRLFVYLRLEEDDNVDADTAMEKHRSFLGSRCCAWTCEIDSTLAPSFFRWEFRDLSGRGAIMSIHPF